MPISKKNDPLGLLEADLPGSATATADTAVMKGRTKKARLMSFIVNRRYDIRFTIALFLNIGAVFASIQIHETKALEVIPTSYLYSTAQ